MPAVRVTELVAASPGQVWAAHIDGPRIAEWFPGAKRVTDISGPLDQIGTTYVLRFNPVLRSRVEVLEVKERAVHTRTWDARPFGSRGTASVLLHPEDRGTRVDLDVEYVLPFGSIGRWLEGRSSVRRRAARGIRRELHAFARFVERRSS